jgi:hypothetical protein
VHIRIELLACDAGVEALETVLLEGIHEDVVGHLEAIVQCDEVGVIGGELFAGHSGEGAVEIVDAFDEIAGEALEGEVFGGLDFALGSLLEIAVVGY